MKKIIVIFLVALSFYSCSDSKKADKMSEEPSAKIAYTSFGEKIDDDNVLSEEEIAKKYNKLKTGDTIALKFRSKVNEVCQNKGCWMKVEMGDSESMVKFKDYGFFMPKDIAGEEVIVSGVAYVDEMSVEDQRHYAKDAGKTEEEIAAITEPQKTLSFLSNGVLIAQKD